LRARCGGFYENIDSSFTITWRERDTHVVFVGIRLFADELAVNPDLSFAGDVAEIKLAIKLFDWNRDAPPWPVTNASSG
jgi:hypothetical protein